MTTFKSVKIINSRQLYVKLIRSIMLNYLIIFHKFQLEIIISESVKNHLNEIKNAEEYVNKLGCTAVLIFFLIHMKGLKKNLSAA